MEWNWFMTRRQVVTMVALGAAGSVISAWILSLL
jgi:hypothetical protein